jgi:uncharacterized delta-60 repeat protein
MRSCLALQTAALLVASATAIAAPTDLDPAWGIEGRVSLGAGAVLASELEPDGSLWLASAVADGVEIARLDRQGRESLVPRVVVRRPDDAYRRGAVARRADGRIDIVWVGDPYGGPFWTCRREWRRYAADGAPDISFGRGGAIQLPDSCWDLQLVSASDGTSYAVAGFHWYGGYSESIARYAPDGTQLLPLGAHGNIGGAPWNYAALRIDAHGRPVAALGNWSGGGLAVRRFAGPVPDATFGSDGIAVSNLAGGSTIDAVPLDDGGILAVGTAVVGGRGDVVIVRFDARGRIDPTFGVSGVARVPFAREEQNVSGVLAKPIPDGSIIVAATLSEANASPSRQYSRIARLTADGTLDDRFAGGGLASLTDTPGLVPSSLHVRPTGEIVVVGSALSRRLVEQRRGGDLAVRHALRERQVVEYFHEGYGHYFMTADELEIAALDANAGSGWRRTGHRFNAYDSGDPPLVPVCRFWSRQTFAPKSSHFYTPYAAECDQVKANAAWYFERNAFHLALPAGSPGGATCGPDTRPLYRAYNDGRGGAPNHRYTTDAAVLDAMLAQGWTVEGERHTRVFACVPLAE